MKAIFNGEVVAQSDETIVVEGNHYFPRESINVNFYDDSHTRSTCPWKGEARYFSLNVHGQTNQDAAWYYPEPKDAVKRNTRLCRILEGC